MKDYIVLDSYFIEDIQKQVNEKLKDGYVLVGCLHNVNDQWFREMAKEDYKE